MAEAVMKVINAWNEPGRDVNEGTEILAERWQTR